MLIQVMSLWRNDADRNIHARIQHLLSKWSKHGEVKWLWGVGDSTDRTEDILRGCGPDVTVVRADHGSVATDPVTCRTRTGYTATAMYRHIDPLADYVLLHESDLLSAGDIIDLLWNRYPTAGWPVIDISGREQFYDIWAYRDLDGKHFAPHSPYNPYHRCDERYQVSSFGSCWLAPARLVRNRQLYQRAIVDLCSQWASEGVPMFVDPRVRIVQPTYLWEPVAL